MGNLKTQRLILRKYRIEDLYEYLSDSEVVRFEPYKPMTKEEVEENLLWRIRTDAMIAVEQKENHKMIGNIYFWRDEAGMPMWKDTYVYGKLNDRKKG